MTDIEKRRAIALGPLRYPVGRFPKRFAQDMVALARSEAPEITERQAAVLEFLAWRYREQLRHHRRGDVVPAQLPPPLPLLSERSTESARRSVHPRHESPKARKIREKYERAREGQW